MAGKAIRPDMVIQIFPTDGAPTKLSRERNEALEGLKEKFQTMMFSSAAAGPPVGEVSIISDMQPDNSAVPASCGVGDWDM